MPFTVLLVCTGNTCRSAMAEGILKSLIPEGRRDDVVVESAGTGRTEGERATDHARSVCLEHGIDIRGHASRALSGSQLERCDLVLAMARAHVERILSLDGGAAERTSLLSEFAGNGDADVPDPYGKPREDYESTFETLEGHLVKALPSIMKLVAQEDR